MAIEFIAVENMRSGRGKRSGSGIKYGKYIGAITPLVPQLKEAIAKAKDGIIRIKNKDIAKEMGNAFIKLNETSIYWGLKGVLFEKGIVVETGTHLDGCKILVMRTRDKDDVLPASLAKKGMSEVVSNEVVSNEDEDN